MNWTCPFHISWQNWACDVGPTHSYVEDYPSRQIYLAQTQERDRRDTFHLSYEPNLEKKTRNIETKVKLSNAQMMIPSLFLITDFEADKANNRWTIHYCLNLLNRSGNYIQQFIIDWEYFIIGLFGSKVYAVDKNVNGYLRFI